MTREAINAKGEGMAFADLQEVDRAYRSGQASPARSRESAHQQRSGVKTAN